MPVIPAPPAPTHQLADTAFTSLATPSRGSRETSVWRVDIAPYTQATPHQLTREEVFVVLAGAAKVRIGGETAEARAGDAIVVPPDVDFELANDDAETLSLMCCLPVGGQGRIGDQAPFTPPWAQ